MATHTTNLNLIKPEDSDNYDIDDFNDNMDTIDGAVAQLRESVSYGTASYVIDGITFVFQRIGRIVWVLSSGMPTNPISTSGYAGSATVANQFRPSSTIIAYCNANASARVQFYLEAGGTFSIGIASSEISSGNVRMSYCYIASAQ